MISTNVIITYGPLLLGLLYILILLIKKVSKKKLMLNIIIVILVILIIFLIRGPFLMIKSNTIISDENNTEITTTISTTTTTQTTTTIKPTTVQSSTKTTTKKITTTQKVDIQKEVDPSELIGTSSKGYKIEYQNGAYYVDGYLIANKTYALNENWVPTNTHIKITESMKGFCRECIDNEAYKAWQEMKSDASALGLKLWIQSGYRGYYYQRDLYNQYVNRKGKAAADKSSARPGHSEHQTGLAFDLNTITTSFKDTAEGKWVANNCYLYGYIIRYPEGKSDETGYIFEPWHIRYVGKELAKELYNNGTWRTMEEYFGINSKYAN